MTADPHHLSRMSTCWSLVRQAHGRGQAASDAQLELLKRYGDVIHRYLLGALRDPEAAEELSQDFALRFIRGDFSGLDPGKGRFRDYVKTVLFRMVANCQKERRTRQSLPDQVAEPPIGEADFLASWRQELIDRAWRNLPEPFRTVLKLRLDEPELPAAPLARRLAQLLGKTCTPENLRKMLQRARQQFALLILEDVAHSLERPTRAELEHELRELGLLSYCQSELDSWPS